MAQDAMNRWWWPSLMMFGPHDTDSAHSSQSMLWKIKRESNDTLRQSFIDKTVPQAELIGLKVPMKIVFGMNLPVITIGLRLIGTNSGMSLKVTGLVIINAWRIILKHILMVSG
jgi:hypothetical protein